MAICVLCVRPTILQYCCYIAYYLNAKFFINNFSLFQFVDARKINSTRILTIKISLCKLNVLTQYLFGFSVFSLYLYFFILKYGDISYRYMKIHLCLKLIHFKIISLKLI